MTKRAFDKIMTGLKDAIDGRFSRVTRFIVTDLKTARRMERAGHTYTWEMDGGRPTGRCIVRIVERG